MAKVRIGKWSVDEAELDREHEEAVRRGKEAMESEPQAASVKYDRASDRLEITLKNGTIFSVPVLQIQGLSKADPKEIEAVELAPRGAALHWEKLDLDLSLAGLMAGIFGTRAWMAELGRMGGSMTSKAKATAARANGMKGGRPVTRSVAASRYTSRTAGTSKKLSSGTGIASRSARGGGKSRGTTIVRSKGSGGKKK